MATHTEEGTGKHKHKSAAEPFEHHEAPSTKGKDTEKHNASATHESKATSTKDSGSNGSEKEGTGKHAHKSAAEPFEHHEAGKKK